jgi:hypothetical protein
MTDCPTYGGWAITKSSTPYRHVDFKVIFRLLSFNFVQLCLTAGSLRQSCPAFSHRSRLSFRFVAAGSPRQSYPAYSSCSCLSFVLLLLDRYGKAIQLILIVLRLIFVSSFLLDRYGKAVQL